MSEDARPEVSQAEGPYDQPFSVEVNRVATGGFGLGSGPDGRTVFVDGALPGETVVARATTVHRSRVEAALVSVTKSSTDRVEPQCPHLGTPPGNPGRATEPVCGGCDWQHVSPEAQSALRVSIVEDCLRRLAKIDPASIDIRPGPTLPPTGYRTTVRAGVNQGRAGYRQSQSHDLIEVQECLVVHPLIEELLVEGRFGSASEVVIRIGANTGERMVVVTPSADGVVVPSDVVVVGADELTSGRQPHIHEELAGLRLQVSAESFFQCRPDGAIALAETVGDLLSQYEGSMLDAYCGVGLFGALAGMGRQVIGVESNPAAAADARWNLGEHAQVFEQKFEQWQPQPVGVAVADPARVGLRATGCDKLAATGATAIALVSCDPASLARDASLLEDRGYGLVSVTVFDLFGHTSHIETVSLFVHTNQAGD